MLAFQYYLERQIHPLFKIFKHNTSYLKSGICHTQDKSEYGLCMNGVLNMRNRDCMSNLRDIINALVKTTPSRLSTSRLTPQVELLSQRCNSIKRSALTQPRDYTVCALIFTGYSPVYISSVLEKRSNR